ARGRPRCRARRRPARKCASPPAPSRAGPVTAADEGPHRAVRRRSYHTASCCVAAHPEPVSLCPVFLPRASPLPQSHVTARTTPLQIPTTGARLIHTVYSGTRTDHATSPTHALRGALTARPPPSSSPVVRLFILW